MILLNNLTAAGNQTSTVILADGSTVVLTFTYRAAVQRWTFDVARGSFVVKGRALSTFPNLLRLWRSIVPFGLRVQTADGTDPFMADDLSSGRVTVNVLDSSAGGTDVADIEAEYFAAPGAFS